MHEILTLQLGERSNYIATHFWNTQESYFTYSDDDESIVNHDIHFRPGIGSDGSETFTPRTVIYDLKGGFGSLRKINALYEVDEPVAPQGLWNGPTIVQRQTAIQQNTYQQSLDEGSDPPPLTTDRVRYWSDFNRVFFHPRSIVQLNEYEMGSSIMPFENWSTGEELFTSLDKEHDLLDRDLRPFAEEADQLQGIQMMAGVDDAWGGFAARYMDRIRDEYGKTAVWFWGSENSVKFVPREKKLLRLSNTARSLSSIAPQASVFIPLALPSLPLPNYVTLDPQSQWHRSALFSTALESIALPSRLRLHHSSRETFDQLANALNINGNQTIAKIRMGIDQKADLNGTGRAGRLEGRMESADLRVPSQDGRITGFSDFSEENVAAFDIDLFPAETGEQVQQRANSKRAHIFGRTESCRIFSGKNDEDIPNHDDNAGYQRARRRAAGLPIIQRSRIPLPFPILDSFPRIYLPTDTSLGVDTSLSTDSTVAMRLHGLGRIVNRAIDIDEREALSNSLGEMAEAYEEGWDSGSDDDND